MNKFEALGLDTAIVKAITEMGFESPTPIQEKTIPELLNGENDLVALAQTGTGKTAAFGLPLISLIDFDSKNSQAVILCPTRELCMQITRDLQNFSKYKGGANVVAIYGGASMENQTREIRRGAQIIVATPGRMKDMIERGKVNLSNVRYAVLDEADEMLNMGFKEDLDTILQQTPPDKNTWLFSATMPNEVLRISKNYMSNPVEITVGGKNEGNVNIEHVYYTVNMRDKYLALKRIADYYPDIFAIVFCRTKIETQEIAEKLIKDGYNADSLHGDLSQAQRDYVMKRYRNRTLQMLVATDVAARGIDVNDVTHVINYSLPDEIENYTHRSGRTARAGKKGISICLIGSKDIGKIKMIERTIKTSFTRGVIPSSFEACEAQLFSLVKKVHNVQVNDDEIDAYMPKIYEELKDLSKEDIIKRFVSIEFNRFLEYYKNAPDLNVSSSPGERNNSAMAAGGISKLFINIGEMDNLDRDTLKEFICEVSGIPAKSVVYVNVKGSFSFVDVKTEDAEAILKSFKRGTKYNDRNVRVESRGGQERDRGGNRSFDNNRRSGGNSFGGNNRYGRSEQRQPSNDDNRRRDNAPRFESAGGGERKDGFKRKRRPRKENSF